MDSQAEHDQDNMDELIMSKVEEYIQKIHYSERYTDDHYEYRHVILPKPLMKFIPPDFYNPDKSGALRLLTDDEWRGIGIQQSLGWEHYEVHAPEPHVLLFRRPKNFDDERARREREIAELKAAKQRPTQRRK